MTTSVSPHSAPLPAPLKHWRGLGGWNFYFMVKLLLLWQGVLNFHSLENLAFAAFLLLPLPPLWLHRLRHLLALPLGMALFYYDTWLPPFKQLLAQSSVLETFTADYLVVLATRLIPYEWLPALIVSLTLYLFFNQWIRFSSLVAGCLIYLTLVDYPIWITHSGATQAEQTEYTTTIATASPTAAPVDDAVLNAEFTAFLEQQAKRVTRFPDTAATGTPFDVLILNICSLSWSDLRHAGLENHPLFQQMDLIFDRFNSASSYSGPAAIRLLRASCGQSPHQSLFEPALRECYLFDNLARLGFSNSIALNHDGRFGNFIEEVRQQGLGNAPVLSHQGQSASLSSFDGTPIYNDKAVLSHWWQQRLAHGSQRAALFYNTITLHDGNRTQDPHTGKIRLSGYRPRLQTLLDDLLAFIEQLERSGRPVMLVLVPEHGAALEGDLAQIAGMRETPSPAIVQIPVGVKFINAKTRPAQPPVHIEQPSSYLALSELVARLLEGKIYASADADFNRIVRDLPQSTLVAEHDSTVLMRYRGKDYLRFGPDHWIPYPKAPTL